MSNEVIPRLLPEILENIFLHLDGKSVALCEQVCKFWRKLVKNLSQQKSIWKKCCEKEIKEDVRLELLNNCYPWWRISCIVDTDWRVVYKNWCQWRHIGRLAFITKAGFQDIILGKVTCMKISGNCVVTGHMSGDVLLWRSGSYTKVAKHLHKIVDIDFMVFNGKYKNASHILKHDLIVSAAINNIQINSLSLPEEKSDEFSVIFHELFEVSEIRTYKNLIATVVGYHFVSIWQLVTSSSMDFPKVEKLHSLHLILDAFLGISIWGNRYIQVSAKTEKGLCVPIYRNGNSYPYKLLQEDVGLLSGPDMFEEMDDRILSSFLWRYDVSIVTTDRHYMYVNVSGCEQKKYNTMPYLHSYPVTILLYGEILLLGMESGTLVMYLLSDINDLMTLDLSAIYWKHSLSPDSILSLDVAETSGGPVLAARTENQVYVISFIPPHLR